MVAVLELQNVKTVMVPLFRSIRLRCVAIVGCKCLSGVFSSQLFAICDSASWFIRQGNGLYLPLMPRLDRCTFKTDGTLNAAGKHAKAKEDAAMIARRRRMM